MRRRGVQTMRWSTVIALLACFASSTALAASASQFSIRALETDSDESAAVSMADDQQFPGRDGKSYSVTAEPVITADMIFRAWTDVNVLGEPAVRVKLTPEGAQRWSTYTKNHLGSRVAVI